MRRLTVNPFYCGHQDKISRLMPFSSLAINKAMVVSPATFERVRNIPENQSMPAKRAIPSTGIPILGTTIAKATRPPPGTTTVPKVAKVANKTILEIA